MNSNSKIDPASFLAEHYQQLDSNLMTVARLENLLLSRVHKFCSIYPEDCYYNPGWIRLLIMLNKIYLELVPELKDNESYNASNQWIAKWTLDILQPHQSLSSKGINTKLDELLENRRVLLDYIKSNHHS